MRLTVIRRCAADAKRISVPAWQRLQAACGGGPELAGGDVCRACVAARLQGVADAGQDSEEREAVLAILDALDADGAAGAAAGGFFVSRSWLACVLLSDDWAMCTSVRSPFPVLLPVCPELAV